MFCYIPQIKEIKERIKKVKQNFICLQCGFCCWKYLIKLPNGELKKEEEYCKYLVPRRIENGKWIKANCILHESKDYPLLCKEAVFGFYGICPIGLEIWKKTKILYPLIKLPEDIEKIINFHEEGGLYYE